MDQPSTEEVGAELAAALAAAINAAAHNTADNSTTSSTAAATSIDESPSSSSAAAAVSSDDSTSSTGVVVVDASSSTGADSPSSSPPSVIPGRVHLIDYSDYMYIGSLGVGTPVQSFGCVFDTGSADTWVFSDEFPTTSSDREPWIHYFNHTASDTFQTVGDKAGVTGGWGISYGKGRASGRVAVDTLTLGGVGLTSTHLALVTSTGGSDAFHHANEPIDGIFGLGFAGLATSARMAVMPHAGPGRTPAIFSFHMTKATGDAVPDATAASAAQSEEEISAADAARHPDTWFQLGGRDASLAPHGFTDVPILSPTTRGIDGRWVVELDSMSVGNSLVSSLCSGASGSKRCLAWVDTGSSFVLMPPKHFATVMADIIANRPDCVVTSPCGGSVESRVTCSLLVYAYLPTLSLRMAGRDFYLTPEEYVLRDTDQSGDFFQIGFGCAPAASGYDLWLIGDTFLKNYYTVFDMSSQVVAFANRPPLYTLTTPLILLIALTTVAVMAACFLVLYCRYLRHRGVSQPVASPVLGRGRARGYAQVLQAHAGGDDDAISDADELATDTDHSGDDIEMANMRDSDAAPIRSPAELPAHRLPYDADDLEAL